MNKENKKKNDKLSHVFTPKPQTRTTAKTSRLESLIPSNNTTTQKDMKQQQNNTNQQEERRRLLEEFRRKKAEKLKLQNNKGKDKPVVKKKTEEKHHFTRSMTKAEIKSANEYLQQSSLNNDEPDLNKYQTRNSIKHLSQKSAQDTSLVPLEPIDNKDQSDSSSINQPTEKGKIKSDEVTKRPSQIHSSIHSSPAIKASGKPQRIRTKSITHDSTDEIDNIKKSQSVMTFAENDMASTPADSLSKALSPAIKVSGKLQKKRVKPITYENADGIVKSKENQGDMMVAESDMFSTPVASPSKALNPAIKVSGKLQRIMVKPMADNTDGIVNSKKSQRVKFAESAMYTTSTNSPSKLLSPAIKVSGKPQRVNVKPITNENPDEIVNNTKSRNLILSAESDTHNTPASSPSISLLKVSHKRSPNPFISTFGKAQRMKEIDDATKVKEPILKLATPKIYNTPQISQTPPSTILFTKEPLGNSIRRSEFIYDSKDNVSSSSSRLPKLTRLTSKHSPAINPIISSFGKAQRIKVVRDEDNEDTDFLTPKVSDYTSDTTNEENSNDGAKARHFFSILAATPFKAPVKKTGRLLDFSQVKKSSVDDSFLDQKEDKCVSELICMENGSSITENWQTPELQKTSETTSPFLKDISIQTSPFLLNQDKSKPDFDKWTKHYVLIVYEPDTYDIKYKQVVPIPTISFFSIKDAVHVSWTGSELLARAMFYILEADWPAHSKKVGISKKKIPPCEKAEYWIERAKFEERCMHYEEALRLYEKAEELSAKPAQLVKEEREKFLARICSLFESIPNLEHEELLVYQDDFDENNYYWDDKDDLLDDDLSALLEYESCIFNENNEFNEQSQTSRNDIIVSKDFVEGLDDSSFNIQMKRKARKNDNFEQETPKSIDSSLTLLTTVKANKKEREEFGVEKVITPVRRSARIQKSSYSDDEHQTPEDREIAILLEESGITYVPNRALYYNKNLTPLKRSSKKNNEQESDIDNVVVMKQKTMSGKKTVTWEDLKK
ncbi:7286_t:CDS:2 [Funneliformis geosporum]|uniref:15729_t:CDS:1 n=1 Tax=Funneliformis geosporum TaxID=1117311 RepID=A0A9W4SGE1_9GLOM|nr:15729_t:CDS:2 [Funneliformis geosporum]CAI2170286.1 7286_t:CDS:2 [Funneliformis geosporum]